METDESYVPTVEQIDTLLAFLPIFEQEGFVAAEIIAPPGHIPFCDAAPEVSRFSAALRRNGFFCPFDWPAWQDEAARYVAQPETLAGADLLTIRKLFTLHLRKERFCDGHLAAMVECGHVAAVLRRLGELRDLMGLEEGGGSGSEG